VYLKEALSSGHSKRAPYGSKQKAFRHHKESERFRRAVKMSYLTLFGCNDVSIVENCGEVRVDGFKRRPVDSDDRCQCINFEHIF
jgi:hypothetical protein